MTAAQGNAGVGRAGRLGVRRDGGPHWRRPEGVTQATRSGKQVKSQLHTQHTDQPGLGSPKRNKEAVKVPQHVGSVQQLLDPHCEEAQRVQATDLKSPRATGSDTAHQGSPRRGLTRLLSPSSYLPADGHTCSPGHGPGRGPGRGPLIEPHETGVQTDSRDDLVSQPGSSAGWVTHSLSAWFSDTVGTVPSKGDRYLLPVSSCLPLRAWGLRLCTDLDPGPGEELTDHGPGGRHSAQHRCVRCCVRVSTGLQRTGCAP